MKNVSYYLMALALFGCEPSVSQQAATTLSKGFNDYWYAGVAELTSFELSQARYGEVHKGTSVLVFVTEPFSKGKQVKLDNWRDRSEDNVSVLKLNMTKKFLTGIYPYSMMMSTFTPVSFDKYPNTFKVTTSSQEWCGHTWMQLNLEQNQYGLKGFSYFESEGDINTQFDKVTLEDELWTRIRQNPNALPTGKMKLLPSTFYLRLKHREATPKQAELSLEKLGESEYGNQPHMQYSINYKDRSLNIYFEQDFPHTILGWEETYVSGFGSAEALTTTAKRINTIQSPYWGKNSNSDRRIREELGLSIE